MISTTSRCPKCGRPVKKGANILGIPILACECLAENEVLITYPPRCSSCGKPKYVVGDFVPNDDYLCKCYTLKFGWIPDGIKADKGYIPNYGWICTKCGSSINPNEKVCPHCDPLNVTTSTGTTIRLKIETKDYSHE